MSQLETRQPYWLLCSALLSVAADRGCVPKPSLSLVSVSTQVAQVALGFDSHPYHIYSQRKKWERKIGKESTNYVLPAGPAIP